MDPALESLNLRLERLKFFLEETLRTELFPELDQDSSNEKSVPRMVSESLGSIQSAVTSEKSKLHCPTEVAPTIPSREGHVNFLYRG